jgi:hypothetical protein
MQDLGLIHSVFTQNIDNLEHAAGIMVTEQLHGSIDVLWCTRCSQSFHWSSAQVEQLALIDDRFVLNGSWGPQVNTLFKEGKDVFCGTCHAGRRPGVS